MEFEKCYVLTPEDSRPAKRRKVEPQGLHSSWSLRRQAYLKAWRKTSSAIDERLHSVNATTVTEIHKFLDEVAGNGFGFRERIPTGIISAGHDATSHMSVIDQLSRNQDEQTNRTFVSISTSSGSNLKALLKTIVQTATARTDGVDDEDDEHASTRKAPKLLNYDLRILFDHVQERKLDQIVIAIHETEAFDSDLLSELVQILGSWQDRIPFAIIFNIATSSDFLQQRLSRAAIRCIQGRMFDAALSEDEVEMVFEAVTDNDPTIWIGPSLMEATLQRQTDYIQSIHSLRDAVKYAYMSCYYANALSIFLDPAVRYEAVPADHFEAARNLDSFRSFCRRLLDNDDTTQLRDLLDSNESLFKLLKQMIQQGKTSLKDITVAARAVHELQTHLPHQQSPSKSALYVQAMSGKLNDSSLLRGLLLSIRKTPSNTAMKLIESFISVEIPDGIQKRGAELKNELISILHYQTDSKQPLRSEDDIKNSTLRTTFVAQKVELSKQKSTLSKGDAAYTALLRDFTDLLEEYFADSLINPRSLVCHEIFLYDLKSPHRETFTPRPRHAIERALASPHDYLDCECCTSAQDIDNETTLAASHPTTAVLYQLYLESGNLINASDLWQAFRAVVGDERSEEENMALFQRGMAELRYLGLVKSTRKRVDHVAKVAWKGL